MSVFSAGLTGSGGGACVACEAGKFKAAEGAEACSKYLPKQERFGRGVCGMLSSLVDGYGSSDDDSDSGGEDVGGKEQSAPATTKPAPDQFKDADSAESTGESGKPGLRPAPPRGWQRSCE